MKSFYKKGMKIEEFYFAAEKSWSRLKEVDIYLNNNGLAAKEAHSIISDSTFNAICNEDMIDNINRIIKDRHVDENVEKKLNNFINKYLK